MLREMFLAAKFLTPATSLNDDSLVSAAAVAPIGARAAPAADAAWVGATGDFNTAANWTPATVPGGTATFSGSGVASLTVSSPVVVNQLSFSGATSYTITSNSSAAALAVVGAGVTNSSGLTQTLAATNGGAVQFNNSASAGNLLLTAGGGAQLSYVQFLGASTGANAQAQLSGNGVLDVQTTSALALGSLSGTAGSVVLFDVNARETLSVGALGANTSFAGDIGQNPGVVGVLNKVGAGALTLSGSGSYSGGTTVSAGTLVAASNSALGSGGVTLSSGATLGIQGAQLPNALAVSGTTAIAVRGTGSIGTVSGAGSLNILSASGTSGTDVLTLTADNSFTGAWRVGAGATLAVGADGAAGSLGAASVTNGGTLTFDLSGASLTKLVPNVISGAGDVNFLGNAEYELLAADSYTGRTTIGSLAHLDLGNGVTDGSLGGGDIVNQGELAISRTANNFILSNAISGSGSLFKLGAGKALTLTGANSYSGGTYVFEGSVLAGRDDAFGSGDLAIGASGLVDIEGFNQSIGALIDGGVLINNSTSAATLTLNVAGSASFTGQIAPVSNTNTLTLVKNGIGDQSLSGDVKLKRAIVNQGTLTLASNTAAATPTIAFGAGAGATIAFGAGVTQGAPVSGMVSGDTLECLGLSAPTGPTSLALVSTSGGVERWAWMQGANVLTTFDLVGSFNAQDFEVAGAGIFQFESYTAKGAEFKGSGASDVLWFNTGSGLALDWEMSNGVIASSNNPIAGFAPGSGWSLIGCADVTGDGTSDVLLSFSGAGQTTLAAWAVANGAFAANVTLGSFADDSGWAFVGAGDFNFDGADDILLSFTAGGNVNLYDWRVANGVVQQTVNLNMGFATQSGWSVIGTGDFNGDGAADVLFQNSASGLVADWAVINGVAGAFTRIAGVTPNTGWSFDGIGDFDGDGTSDVLWQNGATLAIWNVQNGALKQAVTMDAAAPAGFAFKEIGDYFGTGVSGLIWQNATTGAVQTWNIVNDQLTQATTFGGPSAGSGWGIVG